MTAQPDRPSDDGAGMEQLKMLMSYTIFHIGLYTTLGSALVALLGSGRADPMRWELAITLACLVLAGIFGGIVASNIPHYSKFETFCAAPIGPWDFKWLRIRASLCMRLEHVFFWLGVGFTLWGLGRVMSNYIPAH